MKIRLVEEVGLRNAFTIRPTTQALVTPRDPVRPTSTDRPIGYALKA